MLNNETHLYIMDYHNKFPAWSWQIYKIIYAEYGLLRKIMSDAVKFCFREVPGILQAYEYPPCHIITIWPLEQWTSRSMHKVHKTKKWFDTKNDIYLALLQIHLWCDALWKIIIPLHLMQRNYNLDIHEALMLKLSRPPNTI